MKYPANEGHTRRFQIRFATKEGYFETVSVFQRAGVPLIDAPETAEPQQQQSENGISGLTHESIVRPRVRTAVLPSPDLTTIDQTHHNTRQTATRTILPTYMTPTTTRIDHAAEERASLFRPRFGAVRTPQEHESIGLEGSLWPDVSHLSTTVDSFGSSAPVNLCGKPIDPFLLELRASTAPVHEPKDEDRDLPPERYLPFQISRSTKSKAQPTKFASVSNNVDEIDQHATAGRSERDQQPIGEGSRKSTNHVLAKDIDTQSLLAKVEAKKLKSKSRGASTTKTKQRLTAESQTVVPAKKPVRNIRCLTCRSKRRKCERNTDDPDGMCVPCAIKGQKCSFVVDPDSALPEKGESVPTVVTQVPDSQEQMEQASQSLRLSLRVRGVPAIEDDVALSQPGQSHVVAQSQTGTKRTRQLAMPAPKRLKRAQQDGDDRDKDPTSNSKRSVEEKTEARAITDCTKFVVGHKAGADPLEKISSDATTMTETSLDLDLPPVSVARVGSNPTTKQQVTLPGTRTDSHQRQRPRSLSNQPARPTETSTSDVCEQDQAEAQDMFHTLMTSDLSTFLTMSPDQQNNIVDSFFSVALFSNDFLKLANLVESRWKTEMFDSKI